MTLIVYDRDALHGDTLVLKPYPNSNNTYFKRHAQKVFKSEDGLFAYGTTGFIDGDRIPTLSMLAELADALTFLDLWAAQGKVNEGFFRATDKFLNDFGEIEGTQLILTRNSTVLYEDNALFPIPAEDFMTLGSGADCAKALLGYAPTLTGELNRLDIEDVFYLVSLDQMSVGAEHTTVKRSELKARKRIKNYKDHCYEILQPYLEQRTESEG